MSDLGAPDHVRAFDAITTLRAEMRKMEFETAAGRYTLLHVAGRMLDMIVRLIEEHRRAEVDRLERYRRPTLVVRGRD